MSRKHYIATANILCECRADMDELAYSKLISKFSFMFAQDNPNFISSKFREACYQ